MAQTTNDRTWTRVIITLLFVCGVAVLITGLTRNQNHRDINSSILGVAREVASAATDYYHENGVFPETALDIRAWSGSLTDFRNPVTSHLEPSNLTTIGSITYQLSPDGHTARIIWVDIDSEPHIIDLNDSTIVRDRQHDS